MGYRWCKVEQEARETRKVLADKVTDGGSVKL